MVAVARRSVSPGRRREDLVERRPNERSTTPASRDPDGDVFSEHRSTLFGLAYRMLGSVADADDVVQEAWIRWSQGEGAIGSPRSFLITTVTRLCIDQLRSARIRRETYVGVWLPEPLLTDSTSGEDTALFTESLSMAFLHLLERLSPVERAVFLLKEVFSFPWSDIASMVDKSEAACRQIGSRARRRVGAAPRHRATREEAVEVAGRFVSACTTGELDGFVELLSEDVVVWSDSGGKAAAARLPVVGSERTARFFRGLASKWQQSRFRMVEVNGGLAVGMLPPDGMVRLIVFELEDGKVTGVFVHANPDKLGALG